MEWMLLLLHACCDFVNAKLLDDSFEIQCQLLWDISCLLRQISVYV